MTLLEFVKREQNRHRIVESFSQKDTNRALSLIDKYLKSKISNLIMLESTESFETNGKQLVGNRWICLKSGASVRIGWEVTRAGSVNAYCVDFFSDARELFAGKGKTTFSVYTNGASVALILPLIVEVLNTGVFDGDSALVKKLASATVSENFRVGRANYRFVNEDEDPMVGLLRKKRSLQSKKSTSRKMGLDVSDIENDIAVIDRALNSNDAGLMKETLLTFSYNVPTVTFPDPSVANAQKKFEKEKEVFSDPKKAFKMLEKYLMLGIMGNRNCVLICGAPGVGKTFRVTRFLKTVTNPVTGRLFTWAVAEDIIDADITILKGKSSASALYKYLWRTKEHGQVLLIDDCDSVLREEDAVNILKAAADGGEDRLVSWAVSKKIKDVDPDDPTGEIELPKSFLYNGKIIILTNIRAGQVDTAIRSRAYIQDINFTVESVLQIIEEIIPSMNHSGLTDEGKRDAFEFLKKLAEEGADMEISIRTFETCAGILSVINGEDKELAYAMIRENMRLQFDRSSGRY